MNHTEIFFFYSLRIIKGSNMTFRHKLHIYIKSSSTNLLWSTVWMSLMGFILKIHFLKPIIESHQSKTTYKYIYIIYIYILYSLQLKQSGYGRNRLSSVLKPDGELQKRLKGRTLWFHPPAAVVWVQLMCLSVRARAPGMPHHCTTVTV